jgi:hypothetical protein
MSKKPLEVVDLLLGIDSDKLSTKPELSTKTQTNINAHDETKLREKEEDDRAKEKIKEAEQNIIKQTTECFNKLLDAGNTGIDSLTLQAICGGKNMLSISGRLSNLIKKRGGLWKLHKRKLGGKTIYCLKTV